MTKKLTLQNRNILSRNSSYRPTLFTIDIAKILYDKKIQAGASHSVRRIRYEDDGECIVLS